MRSKGATRKPEAGASASGLTQLALQLLPTTEQVAKPALIRTFADPELTTLTSPSSNGLTSAKGWELNFEQSSSISSTTHISRCQQPDLTVRLPDQEMADSAKSRQPSQAAWLLPNV